jgi:hypothetical protein
MDFPYLRLEQATALTSQSCPVRPSGRSHDLLFVSSPGALPPAHLCRQNLKAGPAHLCRQNLKAGPAPADPLIPA